ncbi:hypothetical protein B5S33_g3409 [[Candida] boidinii]|nr:hypothetical protein B5S30_g4300 [[Candida] boidinii]OWB84757.1 hypothetical protein B5S33_g3409 [[Candida] boidinii]GMF98035.1 unnamed protein product [[Candida] boidinii]
MTRDSPNISPFKGRSGSYSPRKRRIIEDTLFLDTTSRFNTTQNLKSPFKSPSKSPSKSPFRSSPERKKSTEKLIFDNYDNADDDDEIDKDDDNEYILRLRSPRKRTMTDLNRSAIKKAMQLKHWKEIRANGDTNTFKRRLKFDSYEDENDNDNDDDEDEDDDDDEDEDGELAMADRIIAESKKDGFGELQVEESDEYSSGEEEDDDNEKDIEDASKDINKHINNETPTIENVFTKIIKQQTTKKPVKLLSNPKILKSQDKLLISKTDERSVFYDGFEGYFEQHKAKSKKYSGSTMAKAPEIDYNTLYRNNRLFNLIAISERKSLINYYKNQYTQWLFELTQNYNLLFYGIGSKRKFLIDFIQNYIFSFKNLKKINTIVINGYNPDTNSKNVFKMIWKYLIGNRPAMPSQPHEMISLLKKKLQQKKINTERTNSKKKNPNNDTTELKNSNKFDIPELIILFHNIDGQSFRNSRIQSTLSQIASLNEVWMISSIDNVNTPLLWNVSTLSDFKFCFHDITNYENYTSEISFKDPLGIGKSNKFVGSNGAKYVLSSLTNNARSLYRNLLYKQIECIDEWILDKPNGTGENSNINNKKTNGGHLEINRNSMVGSIKLSFNLKDFYNSCLEEFIISNEISFRNVLGEFSEHKMCTISKDNTGTEMIFIPFSVDEMEKLLEDELS